MNSFETKRLLRDIPIESCFLDESRKKIYWKLNYAEDGSVYVVCMTKVREVLKMKRDTLVYLSPDCIGFKQR